ncbi:MAG TPA: GreA/GreB family elongation factor [Verrucomicrobiota bacterium]|nr:GreA/GreB family elongation factor [Verrucomicrobiota bacterium]
MSKAFTREDDDRPEPPLIRPPAAELPPGAKNYLTPDGAQRFREELNQLVETLRPKATNRTDSAESSEELQRLDERIRQLRRILRSATVVKTQAGPADRVRFGATVQVRERSGEETLYRIVGIDEADPERGWVSWLSPVAKALLNGRVGQRVSFHSPAGGDGLEILSVRYE